MVLLVLSHCIGREITRLRGNSSVEISYLTESAILYSWNTRDFILLLPSVLETGGTVYTLFWSDHGCTGLDSTLAKFPAASRQHFCGRLWLSVHQLNTRLAADETCHPAASSGMARHTDVLLSHFLAAPTALIAKINILSKEFVIWLMLILVLLVTQPERLFFKLSDLQNVC